MTDKPKEWITVNGAHVPLDEEGGLTGKVGEKIARESGEAKPDGEKATEREETPPENGASEEEKEGEKEAPTPLPTVSSSGKKPYSAYLQGANGNTGRAVMDYYDENLKGKPTKPRKELNGNPVHFVGGKDRHKFRFMTEVDPVKAEAMQYVRGVIDEGKYLGSSAPYDEEHAKRYKAIHYFQAYIPMKNAKGELRKLIVDVGQKLNGEYEYVAHSFIHNEGRGYKTKVRELRKRGVPAEDKKRLISDARTNGIIIRPDNPPGGIFLRSGHRKPAFDENIGLTEAEVNRIIDEAAREA